MNQTYFLRVGGLPSRPARRADQVMPGSPVTGECVRVKRPIRSGRVLVSAQLTADRRWCAAHRGCDLADGLATLDQSAMRTRSSSDKNRAD